MVCVRNHDPGAPLEDAQYAPERSQAFIIYPPTSAALVAWPSEATREVCTCHTLWLNPLAPVVDGVCNSPSVRLGGPARKATDVSKIERTSSACHRSTEVSVENCGLFAEPHTPGNHLTRELGKKKTNFPDEDGIPVFKSSASASMAVYITEPEQASDHKCGARNKTLIIGWPSRSPSLVLHYYPARGSDSLHF